MGQCTPPDDENDVQVSFDYRRTYKATFTGSGVVAEDSLYEGSGTLDQTDLRPDNGKPYLDLSCDRLTLTAPSGVPSDPFGIYQIVGGSPIAGSAGWGLLVYFRLCGSSPAWAFRFTVGAQDISFDRDLVYLTTSFPIVTNQVAGDISISVSGCDLTMAVNVSRTTFGFRSGFPARFDETWQIDLDVTGLVDCATLLDGLDSGEMLAMSDIDERRFV